MIIKTILKIKKSRKIKINNMITLQIRLNYLHYNSLLINPHRTNQIPNYPQELIN